MLLSQVVCHVLAKIQKGQRVIWVLSNVQPIIYAVNEFSISHGCPVSQLSLGTSYLLLRPDLNVKKARLVYQINLISLSTF